MNLFRNLGVASLLACIFCLSAIAGQKDKGRAGIIVDCKLACNYPVVGNDRKPALFAYCNKETGYTIAALKLITETGAPDSFRPRVIVITDFPPLDVIPVKANYGPDSMRSDPDDIQSMVRFLLYTNDFDVEGLVASAGTLANIARKQNILDILDLYDRVDENLRKHDPRYPTADKLRSVTWQGRHNTYGRPAEKILGKGEDSEASDAIIRVVDRPDPRPVWICVWGGPREVAQAIWKVQHTRSSAELRRFLGKLRIYMIGEQDGSAQWLLDNFPSLFIIVSKNTYFGMFAQHSRLGDLDWINENIRKGHGPLGAVYPKSGYDPRNPGQQEGDSPSFLYLISAVRGLNNPEKPNQQSWGGQFIRKDSSTNHWFDGPGPKSVSKFRVQVQKDFAERADWMVSVKSRSVHNYPNLGSILYTTL